MALEVHDVEALDVPEARKVETDDIRQVAGVGAEPVQPVASDVVKDHDCSSSPGSPRGSRSFRHLPTGWCSMCLGFPPPLAVTKLAATAQVLLAPYAVSLGRLHPALNSSSSGGAAAVRFIGGPGHRHSSSPLSTSLL